MQSNQIDLSRLPPPAAVAQLDYASIRDAMLAELNNRCRAVDADHRDFAVVDPAYMLVETAAYRELHLRQQLNDQALKLTLAYAAGAELDHIGVTYYRTARLVITQADPAAAPPVEEVLETDAAYRARLQLATEGWSNAGSYGAYMYHALSGSQPITSVELSQPVAGEIHAVYRLKANPAIAKVQSVGVTSPKPGEVLLSLLARDNDGVPTTEVLDAVRLACNATSVRPLSDSVVVQAASLQDYAIDARLTFYPGSDRTLVLEAAQKAAEELAAKQHAVGKDITLSAVFAALHQPGVHKVELASPAADVLCDYTQAPRCTAIAITDGGTDE